MSIRDQGLFWAAIGFMVPVLWGVLGFVFFNAPESRWTDLFWFLAHTTCPFLLLPETSIGWVDWLDAPILNACLYGSIGLVIARILRFVRAHTTSRDTAGPSNNRWRGP